MHATNISNINRLAKLMHFARYRLAVFCIMKYYVDRSFWASFSIFGCNLEICHWFEISKRSNMYNIKKIGLLLKNKCKYALTMINIDNRNDLNDCRLDFEQFGLFMNFLNFINFWSIFIYRNWTKSAKICCQRPVFLVSFFSSLNFTSI